MEQLNFKMIIEALLVLLMFGFLIFLFLNRKDKGVGKRFIQFTSIVLLIPSIIILALEKIIEVQLIGTLLGTIIGYVLSDLAKDEKDDD